MRNKEDINQIRYDT